MIPVRKLIIVCIIAVTGIIFAKYIHISQNEIVIYNKYAWQTNSNSIAMEDVIVYVISLDRTPERYKKIKYQLDKHNIKHIRFSAVDGYNIKISDGKQDFFGRDLKSGIASLKVNQVYQINCPSSKLTYKSDSTLLARTLNAGEFGCYCSHKEIWNNIITQKQKYTLVLEDDAILSEDFLLNFKHILHNLPKDWDLVFLYIYEKNMNDKFCKILNNPYLTKIRANSGAISSTAAYFISYEGAKKLFSNSTEFTFPIDNTMSNLINNKTVKGYKATLPFISAPDTGEVLESTITEMGARNK